jgi:hypothetical protein
MEGPVVKRFATVVVLWCSAGGALAQQSPAPAAAPVKMECRSLASSGNVVFPNETIVNGLACHAVSAKPAAVQPAAALVVPAAAPAQPVDLASMRINAGSTVYVEPMDGFENYIQAALRKKDVPLMPIADELKANYILRGSSDEKKADGAKVPFLGQIHSGDAASVQLIDRRTGAIVFAYAVARKNTLHGQQTTAEACAKHLKEQIEK